MNDAKRKFEELRAKMSPEAMFTGTAQDYIYCNDGERVDLKPSNGNTATYHIRY